MRDPLHSLISFRLPSLRSSSMLKSLECNLIPSRSPCVLGEIPQRQILHPMPFYQIFGFSDFRKSGKSECPKINIFDFSGFSEIRFPKVRTSGNPKIRIFRFPDFRISENQDFRKSENPDFPISGASDVEFSGASDAGHRMGPDPSEKHGDTATRC